MLDELLQERVVTSRGRQVPRGLKRKMSSYPLRRRGSKPLPNINIQKCIKIIK